MIATAAQTAEPSPTEARAAQEASRAMARLFSMTNKPNIPVEIGGEPENVELPREAVRLLIEILTEMGKGNAVTLMPIHAELTTQQAADLLNVSRPFIVELLNQNKIPYRKVGSHRRIEFGHLIAYQKTMEAEQKSAVDELTREAQELGLGYD